MRKGLGTLTVLGNLTAGRIRAVTGDIGAIDVGGQAGGAGRGNLQAQVQADAGDILEIKVNGDFKLPAGMTTDAQLVSAPKGAVVTRRRTANSAAWSIRYRGVRL